MEYPALLDNAVSAVVMHCYPTSNRGLLSVGWVLKESPQGPSQ